MERQKGQKNREEVAQPFNQSAIVGRNRIKQMKEVSKSRKSKHKRGKHGE
jgi:hypothetical protein